MALKCMMSVLLIFALMIIRGVSPASSLHSQNFSNNTHYNSPTPTYIDPEPSDWHSQPDVPATTVNLQLEELNLTTNKSITHESDETNESNDKEAIQDVDWNIVHQLHTNTDNIHKEITHYQVEFKSFLCKDIHCHCKHIDLKLKIGSIQRVLNGLSCDHFHIPILPDITYHFQLSPNVVFDDEDSNDKQYIIGKSKIFSITKQIDSDISSFGLVLKLDGGFCRSLNSDINELSRTLMQQISELSKMNRHQMSFAVEPLSRDANIVEIRLIVPKIAESTEPQMIIEQTRNLLYESDTCTSLLCTVVKHSDSIEPVAIALQEQSISSRYTPDSVESLESNTYGFFFICAVVMLACCFLMSKYVLPKLSMYSLWKAFCSRIQRFITQSSNSSLFNNQFLKRPSSRKYDILNISEDLDAEMNEDESGIVVLTQVFEQENVPFFKRESYIRMLRDNWLTTTEQLKQLNKQDWIRFGIPQKIQDAIIAKLFYSDDDSTVSTLDISNELSYAVVQSVANDETAANETDFSDF